MKRIIAIAAVVALFSAMPAVSYATTPKAHAQGVTNPTGPITTSGSETLKGGVQWTSYGVTLSNLQFPSETYAGCECAAANSPALATMESELDAIAGAWHGNTVRIQIQQDQYLDSVNGDPTQPAGYNPSYYENLTNDAISYALSLGLVVVVNDQTETNSTGPNAGIPFDFGNEDLPTQNTVAFWQDMASLYGSNDNVIFDLFNEPRQYSSLDLWANGGTGVTGGPVYTGMNQLVQDVQVTDGASNQLWIEGPGYAFQKLLSLAASGTSYFITGNNLVYSFHHVSTVGQPQGAAAWAADFGDIETQYNLPVVDGEWTNRTAIGTDTNQAQCWPDAPTEVPVYLSYLQSLNIGMSLWTIGPDENDLNYDVENRTSSYSTPISYAGWTSGCVQPAGAVRAGAGQDVMNWYAAQDSFNP